MSNFWVDRNYNIHTIRKMSTKHIENTMSLLEANDMSLCVSSIDDELFGAQDYSAEYERMHLELRIRKLEGRE